MLLSNDFDKIFPLLKGLDEYLIGFFLSVKVAFLRSSISFLAKLILDYDFYAFDMVYGGAFNDFTLD